MGVSYPTGEPQGSVSPPGRCAEPGELSCEHRTGWNRTMASSFCDHLGKAHRPTFYPQNDNPHSGFLGGAPHLSGSSSLKSLLVCKDLSAPLWEA